MSISVLSPNVDIDINILVIYRYVIYVFVCNVQKSLIIYFAIKKHTVFFCCLSLQSISQTKAKKEIHH